MLIKDLQTLGFTKNLATVYLTLFDLGQAKAGDIIKKTGLHRNIVYTSLETLELKNLVAKSEKRGVALYQTLDPSRLLNELQERENLAQQIITELKTKREPQTQEVIVHEGREEMQRVYLHLYQNLPADEVMYIINLSTNWFEVMTPEIIDRLIAAQNKNKFIIKGIGDEISTNEVDYRDRTNGLTQMKVLPSNSNRTSETLILSDRIIINEFTPPFTSVEILNTNLVQNYRNYFEVLWNQETKTFSGWEAVQKLFLNDVFIDFKKDEAEYVIGAGYGQDDDQKVTDMFWAHNSTLIKKGIIKHALFYEKHRAKFTAEVKKAGDPNFKLTKVRYLPDEYYSPVEIHIFGDKATVSYFGDNPVSTFYEKKEIVAGFKNQFKLLWEIAKE